MENKGFAHLHLHSEYSLQDGMGKVKDIVKKVKECGMTACAITDHGVAYGLVEFHDACIKEGIKPILGCEVYMAPSSRFDKKIEDTERYYHLILLVKSEIGYKNLCILISRSNTEGFYYRPRIDFELLKEHHEGLICLSACVAGEIPSYILSGKEDKAKETIRKYKELFGDDFYLEIQNHGLREEYMVQQAIIRFVREMPELNLKIVATNDVHYVNTDDKEAHDWLVCLQTEKKVADENRMRYVGDYSIKTEEEMLELFKATPEAVYNTMEIVNKCDFRFEYGNYRMPKVVIPQSYGNDYFAYLQDEAYKGLDERYPEGHPEREEGLKKLEYELGIVKQMGFAEYFLDTRKTILWARENGILVGPGRGSGAGSVMNYSLKITDIDPIRYGLLFERFLNPERISMPDIDVDYDYSHKDDVVAFEAQSNGRENFAKIQTFGTMLAKGVLRDCARVAGYPASVGSKLASFIPTELGITLDQAYAKNPEIAEYLNAEPALKKVWEVARKLEGTKKSAGTHACGHIPTPVPCEQLFPVSLDKETGYLICQYNMTEAEHLGNLKKDLLMLRNLTVIDVATKLVQKRYGVTVPLWTSEILNDAAALDMIAKGDTDGVFQLESAGMKDFLKQLKPDCFEDIIAGVSLYRPGPMDFIPQYIRNKKDHTKITYITPELEPILKNTYGIIVYQEQVMQIVQQLANFTMGHADVVRKAMGKKKQDIMDAERINFEKGCLENNINEQISNSIYDDMVDFAKYAFNKSHAACYAAISMQTAYLKTHYPKEFFVGLLSSVMDSDSKLSAYIASAKSYGIEILPPCLNKSERDFTIEGNAIRFGLLALKGVGEEILTTVLKERALGGAYKGITNLASRVKGINRKMLEALVKSGAMDYTGNHRRAMLIAIDSILKMQKSEAKTQVPGQMSLFSMMQNEDNEPIDEVDRLPEVPEYTKRELLVAEKESTGLYISGHPLDDVSVIIKKRTTIAAAELYHEGDEDEEEKHQTIANDTKVVIAGIVKAVKTVFTKKDNKPMAILSMEDTTGEYTCVVFPKVYEKCKRYLKEDGRLLIEGKVADDKGNQNIQAESISDIDELPKKIWVQVKGEAQLADAKRFLSVYTGKAGASRDLLIVYRADTKEKEISSLQGTPEMILVLQRKFGNENVAITG